MTSFLRIFWQARSRILISFLVLLGLLFALLAIRPAKFQAHMSFLVRNERAENLVSADPSQNMLQQADVLEERINSEVELLGSTELLQAVVHDNHLENEFLNKAGDNQAEAIEKATRKLSKHLDITGVRKSAVIEVVYTASDRTQAKAVLDSLSAEYLSQYSKLHNAGGAAGFYRAKTETLDADLRTKETQRAALLARAGYMALPEGRKMGLEQIVELQRSRNETASALAETESRLDSAKTQQRLTPTRLVTQQRSSSNPYTVEKLNTSLAELQNQRSLLQTKFLDGDPLLVQVDREIKITQDALTRAGTLRSDDATSDVNPIRQTLDGEANQLTQSRAGLASKLEKLDSQLASQRTQLTSLEQAGIDLDTLDRTIKILRDSVDLYRGKYLAASAAEEMDPEKFSNVVEATHPTVPAVPAPSPFNVITAVLLALLLSLAVGLMSVWSKLSLSPEFEQQTPNFSPHSMADI